jgi:hypothetical protein
MKLSKLSNLNTRYSSDNPTKGKSDEVHITGLDAMQIMSFLPNRVLRTRFMNHYQMDPLPEIPKYILLPTHLPLFQAINDRILDNHDKNGYEIIPIETSIKTFLNTHTFETDLKIGH